MFWTKSQVWKLSRLVWSIAYVYFIFICYEFCGCQREYEYVKESVKKSENYCDV